jgi:hypothetical protein
MSDLYEKLERVTDRQSFFDFVKALIEDREDEVAKEKSNPSNSYGPGANGWENSTIESYLAAALAWAKDTQMGQTQGLTEELSWKSFAVLGWSCFSGQ